MTQSNDLFAAIDLGSNSFHMLVVRNVDGAPRVVAKVKRKVRLAAGLDHDNKLDLAAMERGWQCLALFAERLAAIPAQNIKVVSTATLRLATNAQEFCERGNEILGLPIQIISGEQEAALIYHGMAVTSGGCGKRLIVDIGGASTELILGEGFTPLVLRSLNMGCVTWYEGYFADRQLNQANFDAAINAAAKVLAPVKQAYLAHQWQLSLGASGSVQAVQEVLIAQGLNELITLEKLELLMAQTISCGVQQKLEIDGLKEERKPVFASGLAILITLFRDLSLQSMAASGGALREGLIAQLIGQPQVDDLRRNSVSKLQQQFQIDSRQAQNVVEVARQLARQLDGQWQLLSDDNDAILEYSAMLHEIGLSTSFLKANEHGSYLIKHSEMVGFSSEQQKLITALIANYKNPIQPASFSEQAWCCSERALQLATILRLAVIISGRYQGARVNDIRLQAQGTLLEINLSPELCEKNPLLIAELTQETQDNQQIQIVVKTR